MLAAKMLAEKSVLGRGEAGESPVGLLAAPQPQVTPREGKGRVPALPAPPADIPSPQDALQQRLIQQDASVLQLKQELLRASMDKEELHNQNVSHCCCCCGYFGGGVVAPGVAAAEILGSWDSE